MKDKFIIVTGYETEGLFSIRISLIISLKECNCGTKITTDKPDNSIYVVKESIQELTKLINKNL